MIVYDNIKDKNVLDSRHDLLSFCHSIDSLFNSLSRLVRSILWNNMDFRLSGHTLGSLQSLLMHLLRKFTVQIYSNLSSDLQIGIQYFFLWARKVSSF